MFVEIVFTANHQFIKTVLKDCVGDQTRGAAAYFAIEMKRRVSAISVLRVASLTVDGSTDVLFIDDESRVIVIGSGWKLFRQK
jgi:hypothetical protein